MTWKTAAMIEASGLAWTHLRDSLYAEAVATAMTIPALLAGHKPENAGRGRVPIVSRDDEDVEAGAFCSLEHGPQSRAFGLVEGPGDAVIDEDVGGIYHPTLRLGIGGRRLDLPRGHLAPSISSHRPPRSSFSSLREWAE